MAIKQLEQNRASALILDIAWLFIRYSDGGVPELVAERADRILSD